ncbi:glutamyl-tRNA reductase [Vitiosangium sp. GDMCC 1.1324]|uniref:glutamyl-tRNA reductase n=1 Tax=Vitiosangium sp. (strain GDMCC 1.1324) TaxID=2138576 RepID=UPI000D396497|nr:glutamyl-tRNA reductase [Vitiosangium sp. GDMCC 1.1324]PTL77421.1 glutamyl-tRNA reductase [Vitiosangium sp. GDMCC 1.1324]
MEFLCIGLSHRTAPLSVRERLALPEDRQVELLQHLAQAPNEALLVSTCNRVELYLAAPDMNQVRESARGALQQLGGPETLEHLYEHRGEDALVHLFRVSASLDSMVLGEAQILGQVKDAFERGQGSGAVRGELTRVCAAAFGCAKRVRTETAIGRAATSMASAAVALASKVFDGLRDKTVLLVGAGEMAELAARHLKQAGATRLFVANRTLSRAESLAAEVGATARPFEELFTLLTAADVVVCSTASPLPLFTKENVGAVGKARKYRTLFMVDLAVPRDIAPEVGELDWVHAYDVDDIQKFVADNAAARAEEAQKAGVLVAQEVARFVRDKAVRNGVPVLAQLRQRGEAIARAEVERTLSSIGDGLTDKQRKSVEAMARAIVNKLLHEPTARLRAVGPEHEGNRLAGAAAELFGLDEVPAPAGTAGPNVVVNGGKG